MSVQQAWWGRKGKPLKQACSINKSWTLSQ